MKTQVNFDALGGGGAVKTGTIEYTTSTTFVIDTGLSEVSYFAFVGSLVGYEDTFQATVGYRKYTSGWVQISNASDTSGTIYQSYAQSGAGTQQTQTPVITNVSGGTITIQGGSNGTWGQLVGVWFAQ